MIHGIYIMFYIFTVLYKAQLIEQLKKRLETWTKITQSPLKDWIIVSQMFQKVLKDHSFFTINE